ncbi:MAG TPA: hypothetical protein VFA77_08740 [Candidatus Eisenbacteria bacterium]|nr:hypothetical protein [Candidatus Eisenbacteria bacterium]
MKALFAMSDFKFACPHCAQRLRCDDRHVGRQILCPKCQHLIVIPAPSGHSFSRQDGAGASNSDATIAPQVTLPSASPADSSTTKL